jgi:hypothetical protein
MTVTLDFRSLQKRLLSIFLRHREKPADVIKEYCMNLYEDDGLSEEVYDQERANWVLQFEGVENV